MSAEDRKRFEKVEQRLDGMDANITDARTPIHRINQCLDNMNERVGSVETNAVRHDEQSVANFNDVRKTMTHNKEIVTQHIDHARNWVILAIALATAANNWGDILTFAKGLL